MRESLGKLLRTLGSLKLAVAIIFFMFVATLLGTLAQTELGLFAAQKRYFESWFYGAFDQPLLGMLQIPLPGGMLLMSLLFVNLFIGGVVRLRRTWSRAGILVTHIGILMLLVAGWAKFAFSDEGALMLWEGERSSEYVSYHDFELTVAELAGDGVQKEWVVPHEVIAATTGTRSRHVTIKDVPLRLRIHGFQPNAQVMPLGSMVSAMTPVVDGFFVRGLAFDPEAERNLAACYVEVERLGESEGAKPLEGILWAGERAPLTVAAGGRTFLLSLGKRRFQLPFDVELAKFIHEYHPGTSMAREYQSDVLLREDGGAPQPIKIRMNEPLRRNGFIAFQSSFGPPNARPGDAVYSVFSVVRNPADQWPLWSLVVMTVGLLAHFAQKLARWIVREVEVAR